MRTIRQWCYRFSFPLLQRSICLNQSYFLSNTDTARRAEYRKGEHHFRFHIGIIWRAPANEASRFHSEPFHNFDGIGFITLPQLQDLCHHNRHQQQKGSGRQARHLYFAPPLLGREEPSRSAGRDGFGFQESRASFQDQSQACRCRAEAYRQAPFPNGEMLVFVSMLNCFIMYHSPFARKMIPYEGYERYYVLREHNSSIIVRSYEKGKTKRLNTSEWPEFQWSEMLTACLSLWASGIFVPVLANY